MPSYITSGSGWERLTLCTSSAALPHAWHETVYSERGTAIHKFLEDCTRIGRDDALKLVDAEWRQACAALNLEGLDMHLALAAEVALAYDFETRTARELGRGQGRKYDDVRETELPATLDIVGVRKVRAGRRGLVVDWKTGWTTRRPVDRVLQLNVGALLAARAYGLDLVEVQLVHVFEDQEPWVQREVIEGWEIDAFELNAHEVYARAREAREQMRKGIMPTEFTTGPWCDGCPSREWCPAQARLIRAVLGKDMFDGEMRMQHLDDKTLVQLWHGLHEAKSALKFLTGKIMGVAASRTLSLGIDEHDGQERWLGKVTYEGNEKLDGEITFDVVSSMLKDPALRPMLGEFTPEDAEAVASEATRVVTSKKDLEAALKKAVPRGKGAMAMREALKRIADAGGSRREWKTDVKEFKTKPLPKSDAPPALPPGDDRVSEEWWKMYDDEPDKA